MKTPKYSFILPKLKEYEKLLKTHKNYTPTSMFKQIKFY